MSTIQIGENEQSFCDVSESWIHQHVGQRKDDGRSVCARVLLKSDSVDLFLGTPQCPRGVGAPRPLTQKEQELADIWNKLHLNTDKWTAGNLTAFVKQAHRLVC